MILRFPTIALAAICLGGVACSSGPAPDSKAESTPAAVAADEAPLPDVASPYDSLPPGAVGRLDEKFTGDLDAMVERRIIRAGVAVNRTHYFIDKGVQRGLAYESLMNFEEALNVRLKTGNLRVHVAFIPLARDQMFPALQEGRVDLLAATLTITPDRQKLAAFSDPTRTGVNEIVVTGPGAPAVKTADDLSGRQVFVRRTSSYYQSLVALNHSLASRKMAPVTIKEAPEVLEDDDILEMVNAGLTEITVVDDYMAQFWQQVFPNLQLHPTATLRAGGRIAVAFRKDNPKIREAANEWIRKNGRGSAFGNILDKRYLQNPGYAKSATSEAERRKFTALTELFRKYGEQYDIDYLLMAAQGYQESRLDQNAKSHVGAVGIMQLMPATGREMAVGDIQQIEPNVHAGVKYIRHLVDEYFKDDPMDPLNKWLMAFASYNAGPGRVKQLRQIARSRGLDPNVWFGNVERVASERIGRETVQYVSNIFKYYVAYKLVLEQQARTKDKR